MQKDLTSGPVSRSMLAFSAPMILGNLFQQLYNVVDTLVVGKCIGGGALAAVGSSFTLITFLTSAMIGLCMGSGALFSMLCGAKDEERLRASLFVSFVFIGGVTVIINFAVLQWLEPILQLLKTPTEIFEITKSYVQIIMYGFIFTFIYNYFAAFLRAGGNSLMPLVFLAISTVLNIALDLLFVIRFEMKVEGAAWATVIAQGVAAILMMLYCICKTPACRLRRRYLQFDGSILKKIMQYSTLTCVQQSIMNFGILMIQGLVNSFGVKTMAAFAAAVKVDAFAYMPVQDFGNAFSVFIAQNYGAGKKERIDAGIRSAIITAGVFSIAVSVLVVVFARPLMELFVKAAETETIEIGMLYLRIEGACYCGIGCLFLLYGLYRGLGRPGISVVLTVISLGTRVVLAYTLAPIPAIGLVGIWIAIPIGWLLADLIGLLYYKIKMSGGKG